MGPDLELKSKSDNMHDPAFSGQKVLEPETNYIGNTWGMETIPIEQNFLSSGGGVGGEDVKVDITGCTNSIKALVVEEDSCEDATEGSSSFGDTGSGSENDPSFSDPEVESRPCAGDAFSSMFDDYCEPTPRRKQRVTSHWRKFIRPIMWRCKWVELQLKKLQSQAIKYDKELAAYNYTKQVDFAHLTLDGSDIKSVPISGRMHRNKIMNRNKRNRVEEKCDLASYTRNHNLFSYFDLKDRRVGSCLKEFHGFILGGNIDDNDEYKLNDLWCYVDYENTDKSLNDIIQDIEAVHSQVHRLKARTEKVIKENSEKFDSETPVGIPEPSQLEPECYMGDLLNPGNTPLNREGVSPPTEATDWPGLEYLLYEDTKDGALVQNQATKEEFHDFENVRIHLIEETKESLENNKSISRVQVSEADMAADGAMPYAHSTLNSRSIFMPNVPKHKRNERKKRNSRSWSWR